MKQMLLDSAAIADLSIPVAAKAPNAADYKGLKTKKKKKKGG